MSTGIEADLERFVNREMGENELAEQTLQVFHVRDKFFGVFILRHRETGKIFINNGSIPSLPRDTLLRLKKNKHHVKELQELFNCSPIFDWRFYLVKDAFEARELRKEIYQKYNTSDLLIRYERESQSRLELEEPYKGLYARGYLRIDKRNNRKRVILERVDGTSTTTSYARYLYAVKLGKFIPSNLEVDHIDEDRTNDDIENLQLLDGEENRKKHLTYCEKNIFVYHDLVCSNCGNNFRITDGVFNRRSSCPDRRSDKYYCSPKCSSESHQLSKTLLQQIAFLDKPENSSLFIAQKIGVSVKAVISHRNNHPEKGLGIKITSEMIDKINTFDPNIYGISEIASLLGISRNSVIKYRTSKPSSGIGVRPTPESLARLDNLIKENPNNSAIARILNIDPSVVSRRRTYLKTVNL